MPSYTGKGGEDAYIRIKMVPRKVIGGIEGGETNLASFCSRLEDPLLELVITYLPSLN